jgi:hypothetical protein
VDGKEVVEIPTGGPSTPVVVRFLERAKATGRNAEPRVTPDAPGLSWKHLEVEKVLVRRWLLGEGAIPVGKLTGQVGCSYPTAMRVVARLSAAGLIARGRGRSVALARYPRERWTELVRARRLVYPPVEFVDPVAGAGAVEGLMGRLRRLHPKGAALGGVDAARRWDPAFDLNGTPRVDVVVHAPIGGRRRGGAGAWIGSAEEWVRRLDPALKRRTPGAPLPGATVLVLHATYRRDALFIVDEPEPSTMPWADPVEVLCDLNDLGLTAQAGAMLAHLRRQQGASS